MLSISEESQGERKEEVVTVRQGRAGCGVVVVKEVIVGGIDAPMPLGPVHYMVRSNPSGL